MRASHTCVKLLRVAQIPLLKKTSEELASGPKYGRKIAFFQATAQDLGLWPRQRQAGLWALQSHLQSPARPSLNEAQPGQPKASGWALHITISFQLLKLVPATAEEDPTLKHDWHSEKPLKVLGKYPGQLVQPINPEISFNGSPSGLAQKTFYLLDTQTLLVLSASLLDHLQVQNVSVLSVAKQLWDFPYQATDGKCLPQCPKTCWTLLFRWSLLPVQNKECSHCR